LFAAGKILETRGGGEIRASPPETTQKREKVVLGKGGVECSRKKRKKKKVFPASGREGVKGLRKQKGRNPLPRLRSSGEKKKERCAKSAEQKKEKEKKKLRRFFSVCCQEKRGPEACAPFWDIAKEKKKKGIEPRVLSMGRERQGEGREMRLAWGKKDSFRSFLKKPRPNQKKKKKKKGRRPCCPSP